MIWEALIHCQSRTQTESASGNDAYYQTIEHGEALQLQVQTRVAPVQPGRVLKRGTQRAPAALLRRIAVEPRHILGTQEGISVLVNRVPGRKCDISVILVVGRRGVVLHVMVVLRRC